MATDSSENTCKDLALVKKGKECFALAQHVCSAVNNISIDDVEQKLNNLKRDAEELCKHTEEKAKEIEKVEEQYMKEIQEIQRKIGKLERQGDELKKQKSETEDSLAGKQSAQNQMHQLSNAESEFRSAQSVQREIFNIESQIKDLSHQQVQYTAKANEMKEVVVFFRKASQFWKEFQQAADEANKNTDLMQTVISKANEKQDLKWLTCGGTAALGVTFLMAWELVETKCEQSPEFMFQKINNEM